MTHSDSLGLAPDFAAARAFFETQANYNSSPLVTLTEPGGITFQVKDETNRMGLGAFKALGAPYAVRKILDRDWQAKTGEPLAQDHDQTPEFRAFAAEQTFVCASAGNHGIGVAAGARDAGAKARIHLADTVPEGFADRLRGLGATVVRSGAAYDDAVAGAIADAESSDGILLADGTWPGYTEIPKWVMEGYCVIAEEMRAQFVASGQWPTHVYLQAGVGGLASAMAHMIRLNWEQQPELVVVEPAAAACLQASHAAGKPTRGDGPDSSMGRLDCKEPSIVAWSVLERCNVRYVTLTEDEGEAAARQISDLGLPTTPSGAAGFGALKKEDLTDVQPGSFRPLDIISEGLA